MNVPLSPNEAPTGTEGSLAFTWAPKGVRVTAAGNTVKAAENGLANEAPPAVGV